MNLIIPTCLAWLKPGLSRALSLAAWSSVALAASVNAAVSDLIVTEIQSNQASASVNDYWELTNVGATSMDISNFKWNDSAHTATGAVVIPAGATIAPGESVIFTAVAPAAFRAWWNIPASVQVINGTGTVPGLGQNDAITLYTDTNTEVFFFSYAAGGFTRSDGTAALGGHAGTSAAPAAGGSATSALVFDRNFGTGSGKRYTMATVGTMGAFASASNAADIGSPGVSGLPKTVDLSTYVRVGRYDLPEPTRTTAPTNNLLCQEASGVTYNWDTDTLFIACDGGKSVTQVSKTGAFINTMTLALGSSPQGTEFYDTEGITYIGGGEFVMTEERDRQLVKFTYVAGTTLTRAATQTVKIGTFVDNTGTEGLSYDPQTGGYICIKEVTPEGIFQTGVNFAAGTATNGSPSTVNSTDLFNPALANLLDFADVFALSNLPSLTGQPDSSRLLLLSQASAKIVNIDRSGNISSSLQIVADAGSPLSADAQQHEGLAMDRNGVLYVVNENGGGDIDHPQLWVYAPSTAPNAAPTAVALNNTITSILENTSTAAPVKVADIIVTDDGLGTNNLTVTGADASFFQITGSGLYINAGTVLDFETKTSYSVTVNVDDATLGSTPDATVNYTLSVTDVVNETPVVPSVFISEVHPTGSSNTAYSADWFEVTNTGTSAVNITGWQVDDNSNGTGKLALRGVTSIPAGKSAVFFEGVADGSTDATIIANFCTAWFGSATPPTGFLIGAYGGAGVGLSSGGDSVNLFDAAGNLVTGVAFGTSTTGVTFDNYAGIGSNALPLPTISNASVVGVHGAYLSSSSPAETGSPGTTGKVLITEVAPWSSSNSPVAADWFEVTNTGVTTVDITGWKMDDNSESFVAAVALNGITSIAPGESVIFIETATPVGTIASFLSNWFGANPPAGLQVGSYTGGSVGLSGTSDAVNLFDSAGTRVANVAFGASPTVAPFATFDNKAGINVATISTLSSVGVNGAFVAVNSANEIGSPGRLATPPSFTTQPASQSIAIGASATLTVAVAGNPTPTVQWYLGNSGNTSNLIAGATATSFTTPALLANASYWARATNSAGTADSNTATITVSYAAAFSSANINVLTPNTATWNPAGVTVNGTTFINLGLQGVGRVPSGMIDPATGESVGSVSDMQITGWKKNANGTYSGTFNFLPDRGYNSGVIFSNYAARINTFDFTFAPYTSPSPTTLQNQVAMTFTGSTRFTYDHDGNAGTAPVFTTGLLANGSTTLFGIPVPVATGVSVQSDGPVTNRLTFDSEGMVLDKRAGKSGTGWVSDEYGPYIYHFNSAKQIDGQLQLPAALVPHATNGGAVSFIDVPANVDGRRVNQGMEGIAQSPDGTKLFGLMQSATMQDSGTGNQGRYNTRLLVYDISSNDTPDDPVAQYVIQLPVVDDTGSTTNGTTVNRTAAQSTIVALNNHQLLILARDGNGRGVLGSASPVFKSILLADLSSATNIDGTYDAAGSAVAAAGTLTPGVVPVTWSEALNMIGKLGTSSVAEVAKFGLNLSGGNGDINTICEKWEALSLVSANDPANPNDYFLFVGNDNDFLTGTGKYMDASGALQSYDAGLENDTIVLAYRVRMNSTDNQAPFVANAIADQTASTGSAFSFAFAADTFSDPESGTLTYTATKGDDSALPAWLSFNASTRTFSGTPGAADVGTLVVKITATDNGTPALFYSTTFSITVNFVPPTFSFASTTASVREDANKVTLTINRTGDLAAATVNVSTANGTGVAGTDYTALSSLPVAFTLNQTTKTVDISVINRAGIRAARTFTATLSSPGAPAVTASPSTTTVTITEADSFATNTGPGSSASPYLQPLTGNFQTTSILSVGDAVPLTGTTTGQTFQMVGLPDGLGAFDNGDGTITVLMNHELGNTLGGVRSHGAVGAFVSEWIINKSTLQVVSGSDLMRNVFGWNATTQTSDSTTSAIAFNRFCSADLPAPTAFYNSATGKGTQARIFMNGDESGTNGYAMAHVATGASKGSSYVLGKFNLSTNGSGLTGVGGWENLLANPYPQDKTVVVGNNDGGTGIMMNSVAVYVGTKTNVGTDADKAGLTNGTLKFVNVTDNALEIPLANAASRVTNITSGMAFTLSATTSTIFSRPEDGAWDPSNPARFYFVTTDRLDQVADGLGVQIGHTRLWRLNFTDITNPDLGGTIDLLLEGGTVGNDANMWDNLTVTTDGKLLLQEDVGGAAHNGKVWFYDPANGSLTKVLKHDISRFGNVVSGVSTAATSPFTNDEEASGIIDVTAMFGGNAFLGDRYFLTSDQAHYPLASPLVEGGQLILVHQIATSSGISSSSSPYLLPVDSSWKSTSVLTVGDPIPLTGTTTGETFQMAGLPDGLGAYDNGNGTMTVLISHEFGNTLGSVRAHGAAGAFVSELIINKSSLQVLSGSDLIRNVYNWNTGTQSSNATTSVVAFNRLCSADLPAVSAFYNAATGLGTQERIFMNGDESGTNGYAMAHVATGASKGNSYVLGKFNLSTNGSGLTGIGGWENLLASPYPQDKTIVVGNNDGGTGVMMNSVAVYVGAKTSVGTEADKAGLTNGTLKFVNVTGNALEIPLANATSRVTNITSGTAFTLSATTSTIFSRPEDGAWDTVNPNRFYFVTTDRLDQVADGLGAQIGHTRLWRLNFTDITNPDLGGTIDLLLEGGTLGNDANMWDNLTVTTDGKLLLQEDVGGAAHNGKIWSYDPVTGSLAKVIQHDPARFGEVVGGITTAATAPFTNDEEASGIIEVTGILGGNAAAGERLFLTSDQAHYPLANPLVEGGQLVLLRQSPKVAFSLASATSMVNEDAGSVELTVSRYGDLQYAASVQVGTSNGTATAGLDFSALSGVVLSYAPGEATKTVSITIANRSGYQGDRLFTVALLNPSAGSVLGGPSSTTLTITEVVTTSVINLADAIVKVNQGAATATINLVRSGGSSPVTVDLQTTNGSAVAGTDFTAPTGAAATVSFAANSNTASKIIALIPNGAAVNRSFTVSLANPGINASVGVTAPTATIVRILASDTVSPGVAISSPTIGQVINYTADNKVTVQGTASDNLEVDKVQVSLNGVFYGNAILTPNGTGASWSLDVLNPPGGTNTLSVTAVDTRGNVSTAATRSFYFKKLSALVVNTTGTGTVTGRLNGVVYEVGKSYTLTAVPGATQTFNGWTGSGLTAPSNEVAKFTFVFTDALFATPVITANFIAKTFTALEIGAFDGLITPHAGTVSGNHTHGSIHLTLTATGTFTGTLKMDGFSLAISGLFNNAGEARFGATRASTLLVERSGKPAFELSQVRWDSAANTISGVIKQYLRTTVTAQSDFLLDRAAFSAAIPVNPATYTAAGGKYTVIIPSEQQSNVLTSVDFPQGTGIGLITITPAGVVSLAGTLADGTTVTASAPLSMGLNSPLFVQLYATKGSFSALVHLDNGQGDSDVKATDALWFRPFQNKVQHYPYGWEEGVTLDLLGAKYPPTAPGSVILNLPSASSTGNATLSFTDGQLVVPSSYSLNISTTNLVMKIPTANPDYALTLLAASGDISGTFAHANGTRPAFKGKVFAKGANAGAHGFFLTTTPKVINGSGESGRVDLIHK